MNKFIIYFQVLISAFLINLWGCSNNSPTDSTNTDTVKTTPLTTISGTVKPKVGSYFNYRTNYFDHNNADKGIVPFFDSVIVDDMNYLGKTNVVVHKRVYTKSSDSVYYAHEANGDVSLLENKTFEYIEWLRLPLTKLEKINFPNKDTTFTIGVNDTVYLNTQGYFENVGEENLKIGLETVSTQKIIGKKIETYIIDDELFGLDSTISVFDYKVNYSRKLGAIVYYSETPDNTKSIIETLSLENYKIK